MAAPINPLQKNHQDDYCAEADRSSVGPLDEREHDEANYE
jgi:hypothetical protein